MAKEHSTLTTDAAAETGVGITGSWPSHIGPTTDYEAALDYLRDAGGHLFVTGRAGTGKSTLLRALCDMVEAEHVVVAPTGLAAVNVGGQTIHSFFGLPPRLIRQEDIRRSRNGAVMRRMKLLIIDEVSMVRADLMWAIDQSLRINRGRPREPFGGVRLGPVRRSPPAAADRAGSGGRGPPRDDARRAVLLQHRRAAGKGSARTCSNSPRSSGKATRR